MGFKIRNMSKIRSIYSNLNINSYIKNKNLLTKVLNKEINPSKIAFMSNMDLYPENWEKILEKKSKIDKMKYTHKKTAKEAQYQVDNNVCIDKSVNCNIRNNNSFLCFFSI